MFLIQQTGKNKAGNSQFPALSFPPCGSISSTTEESAQKVKESDRKDYAAVMGKATILIGVGIILSGILCTGMHSGKYGVIFGISFAAGLIMMIHAQLKYNHGIF